MVCALKAKTFADAKTYGGTVPVSIEVLQRVCSLRQRPGLRETFKEWDVAHAETLQLSDVEKGLRLCAISSDEAGWVLLTDIIMGGSLTISYNEFAEAVNMLA
eukprot:SAG11_NODE_690_length_7706_cov_7.429078_3_plen_103_part_00